MYQKYEKTNIKWCFIIVTQKYDVTSNYVFVFITKETEIVNKLTSSPNKPINISLVAHFIVLLHWNYNLQIRKKYQLSVVAPKNNLFSCKHTHLHLVHHHTIGFSVYCVYERKCIKEVLNSITLEHVNMK